MSSIKFDIYGKHVLIF